MKRLAITCGLLLISIGSAEAYSRCTYYKDGREPRCLYQSDGKGDPYLDGRKHPQARPQARQGVMAEAMRRRMANQAMMRQHMAQQRAKQARGAADWRNSGTPSSVGTISPYVPGSTEDTAWRAERKRRGL
jgi:hypothetical protein